jgi:hypothetical protein
MPRRARQIAPQRQWHIDSDELLPTGRQALDEPFSAFLSWLMKVTRDRCGKERIFAEAHAALQRDMLIRDILAKMRHDGCRGRPGRVEAAHRHRGRQQPALAQDRGIGWPTNDCPRRTQPPTPAQHGGRGLADARRVVLLLLGHTPVDRAVRAQGLAVRDLPPAASGVGQQPPDAPAAEADRAVGL